MEARQPLAQAGAEPGRQALLAAEVDDVKLALRRQPGDRLDQRVLPARDHRQAVGEEDARKARHAEQPGGIEGGGVGRAPARCAGATSVRPMTCRAVLSISPRDVDAVEARLRISPRRGDQVARRAAADLEHAAAGRRLQPVDQLVAAQQIVFARESRRRGADGDRCGPSGRGSAARPTSCGPRRT